MKRATGIGGIFFNAKDPVALRHWYTTHLGIHPEGNRSSSGSLLKGSERSRPGFYAEDRT